MRSIRKRVKRLTAWLLCAAMAVGCCTGLGTPALAAQEDGYEEVQSWLFEDDAGGWAYNDGWTESGIKAETPPAAAQEDGRLKLTVDYSKAAEDGKGWAQAAISCSGLELAGAGRVTMDVFFDPAQLTDGALTVKVALGDGDGSTLVADSGETFAPENGLVKKSIVIDLAKKATGTDFVLCMVGQNTTYNGSIWLDNIRVLKEDESSVEPAGLPVRWTFDSGIDGWADGGSWSYDGSTEISWDAERKMLKLDVDYSNDKDKGWSETKVSLSDEEGFDVTGANLATMDVIFDSTLMSDGGLSIKISDSAGVIPADSTGTVQLDKAADYDGDLKKAVCEINFATIRKGAMNEMTVALVGNNTSYKGPVWLDNITFDRQDVPPEEDVYVDATETARTHTAVSGSAAALTVNGADYPYAAELQLADPDAAPSAVALYQYLKAVGESDGALYGHMEDTVLKAGASDLSYSDTEDMTGSLAAINGLDCGGLFSGFGAKYNARHPNDKVASGIAGDITAAARLSKDVCCKG